MAASGIGRVLRGVGAVAAGGILYTANQYRIVMTCYTPLPEPRGPTTGVVPSTASSSATSSELRDAAAASCRIVFVGDSLVMGVGSSAESWSKGPALPRKAAELIARRSRRADGCEDTVRWSSFAVNGGDVRTLRRQLMPQIRTESAALGRREPVAAVVIICGLNDWKRMLVDFRTPAAFRKDLARLIADIRDELGADVRVVLPGMPSVVGAPFLGRHFPLRWFIDQVAAAWDSQKVILASSLDRVEFIETVSFTEIDADALELSRGESAEGGVGGGGEEERPPYAPDGLHPNEWGYGMWAEQIVAKVRWDQ